MGGITEISLNSKPIHFDFLRVLVMEIFYLWSVLKITLIVIKNLHSFHHYELWITKYGFKAN